MTTARSIPATALKGLIHFYRRFLSPLLPPGCRFQPSCSAYALEAVTLHGAAKGSLLAAKRLCCAVIHYLARRFVGL